MDPTIARSLGSSFRRVFCFQYGGGEHCLWTSRATLAHVKARIAGHEFIEALPQYDTVLGEGGLDLSGGQRQRLAIARAVLLDPAVLLLDDPAAAIDPHTEHEILDAMQRAMLGRTTFVIAHRLSTLRQCDLVIVLDSGCIAQIGTHEELMREAGHYRLAAESQLAGT
jgi:ATP-binding cassette subfamily B protein